MTATETCQTCEGRGFLGTDWLSSPACYECDGLGWVMAPTRRERAVAWFYGTRLGHWVIRVRRRTAWARARWHERDADAVAAIMQVHRPMLDDEPRLRGVIDNDLRQQLIEVTPLRWRQADLRWALANMKRALRGEPMNTDLPYEDVTSVEVSDQNLDLFEGNRVMIRAERRRKPKDTWTIRVNTPQR